jgi:hypothetical protein
MEKFGPRNRYKNSRESLETVLGVEIHKFFDADQDLGSGIFLILDPGWKKFGPGIRDKNPRSATLRFNSERVR